MVDAPHFNPSHFTNEPYVRRIEKPWGYELHLAPPQAPYMMKIIHINAGARFSLQMHDAKQETWTLMNGQAKLIWENNSGEMVETELEPSKGYNTLVGQKHRLMGVTDCDILECSTPERGVTWRLEDDYSRPDETPEQRAKERGES